MLGSAATVKKPGLKCLHMAFDIPCALSSVIAFLHCGLLVTVGLSTSLDLESAVAEHNYSSQSRVGFGQAGLLGAQLPEGGPATPRAPIERWVLSLRGQLPPSIDELPSVLLRAFRL